jgi:hypothetical protein
MKTGSTGVAVYRRPSVWENKELCLVDITGNANKQVGSKSNTVISHFKVIHDKTEKSTIFMNCIREPEYNDRTSR